MKRIFGNLLNSGLLFLSYLIANFLLIFALTTPMRMIGIPADTRWEYLWKAIVGYGVMIAVCVGQLLLRQSGQKVQYLKATEGSVWNVFDMIFMKGGVPC